MGTLAAGIVVLLIAGNAVRCIWKDKKSGKSCSGCGCGCGGCSGCRTKN
ncbi:MAG: FeoB-associated Cys-rich membrane protein [Lachnospiraceae bacterium]|nr:FeoB-associated Cys-rich membrane protein [Lachnospiraceae bacterium]MCI9658506.1 FeoB-associated Cys-rich membrane protein [Lachnospiraceae bacterium]